MTRIQEIVERHAAGFAHAELGRHYKGDIGYLLIGMRQADDLLSKANAIIESIAIIESMQDELEAAQSFAREPRGGG